MSLTRTKGWNGFISTHLHCVKSIRTRSFSGPYSVRMLENTSQWNSEYGYFSRSVVFCCFKDNKAGFMSALKSFIKSFKILEICSEKIKRNENYRRILREALPSSSVNLFANFRNSVRNFTNWKMTALIYNQKHLLRMTAIHQSQNTSCWQIQNFKLCF